MSLFSTGANRNQIVSSEVVKVLLKTKNDSEIARFASLLFADVHEEDINLFSYKELASYASHTYELLKKRKPGQIKVDISDSLNMQKSAEDHVSIINIVNDNTPFLVSSVTSGLRAHGVDILMVAHPVIYAERDLDGKLIAFYDQGIKQISSCKESVISIYVNKIFSQERKAELKQYLENVLSQIKFLVVDWRPMINEIERCIDQSKKMVTRLSANEVIESIEFLRWITNDNFIFFGMRTFNIKKNSKDANYQMSLSGRGLGILSDASVKILNVKSNEDKATPELKAFLDNETFLMVTKSRMKSIVHRLVYMDNIGFKLYDENGKLEKYVSIIGLFTSTSYTSSIATIPYVRRKADMVLRKYGFDADSHSGKVLMDVLEQYPRDELFQIDSNLLSSHAFSIMRLEQRYRVRVLVRRDLFEHFVSILVFIPRDRSIAVLRNKICKYLEESFGGTLSAQYNSFPGIYYARIHFILGLNKNKILKEPIQSELEGQISSILLSWEGCLSNLLISSSKADEKIFAVVDRLDFSEEFKASNSPEQAFMDVLMISKLEESNIKLNIVEEGGDSPYCILRNYVADNPIPLSSRVPLLENMGITSIAEESFKLKIKGGKKCYWISSMKVIGAKGDRLPKDRFQDIIETYIAVNKGLAVSDSFNSLVMTASMSWHQVMVFRAYANYLEQAKFAFSLDYISQCLVKNSKIANMLWNMFQVRFDPKVLAKKREKLCMEIFESIKQALNDVTVLAEDKIVQSYVALIRNTARTNFFKYNSSNKTEALSFKILSSKLPLLPVPRPKFEIFVYSSRVKGIHLRFDYIARGGIRWSDRVQDFRTEVLGLVKAQQVKNSVIVPVGSKGGFVTLKDTSEMNKSEILEEGQQCYEIYISALLELTDNNVKGKVVHPSGIVCWDESDPYLVVAPDKGTASFSDLANSIAIKKGFWLGDAFASGGSTGYDHKKMGITSAGAWVAVSRHFREMGIDVQKDVFTCTGIGDMSGDVFGNGMLMSCKIKLVAAFDHRDIFIDPDPDPEKTYKERARLFKLAGSSWQNFDRSKMSDGGMVVSRSKKSIKLNKQIKKVLGVNVSEMSPDELIKSILRMKVKLLWLGGIGTYVRSQQETNYQVGDRANDNLRIVGAELGAEVVGEGGNLGMTQLARIEYNENGGRCNTDAIDNCGGVSCSDMEVNLKLGYFKAVSDKVLTLSSRNKMLTKINNDVGEKCKNKNYLQTLALSMSMYLNQNHFEQVVRLIKELETRGILDRKVEQLPDNRVLRERKISGKYFFRSELCVLLAYVKIAGYIELLQYDILEDEYLAKEVNSYFPIELSNDKHFEMHQHPLHKEIIATELVNSFVNRCGITAINQLMFLTGKSMFDVTKAYVCARDIFNAESYFAQVDVLDGAIDPEVQLKLYLAGRKALIANASWLLRNVSFKSGIADVILMYKNNIQELSGIVRKVLPRCIANRVSASREYFEEHGVSNKLSHIASELLYISEMPDIVWISVETKMSLVNSASAYYHCMRRLKVGLLMNYASAINATEYYDNIIITKSVNNIMKLLRSLVIKGCCSVGFDKEIDLAKCFCGKIGEELKITGSVVEKIAAEDIRSLSRLLYVEDRLSELYKSI